jgi:hypothetical protein
MKFLKLSLPTFVVLLSLAAFAQETATRGSLGGVVQDPTNAIIQGAHVTIVGPTGTNSMSSASDGRFLFGALIPGTYSIKVDMKGFRTTELSRIDVFTGRTSNVTMTLTPGAATETVEVSAGAVTVDPAETGVNSNLNDEFYSQVPMARGVTGIFYASPGVNTGLGTGPGNPSISGGSGLENEYVADGVNITDGSFGGIGVFSRVYGSLSTGINLSFVKEVQVKTGGFEPQYGKTTGGLVQIVTKSGSTQYHGGVSGFFGPQQFEATRLNADDYNRLNQYGKMLHKQGYDVAGELGGYVPGFRDHLFFFGSFDPTWNTQFSQLSTLHGVYNYPLAGKPVDLKQTFYNYSAKLTWKISSKHQIESSVYGDPTRSNDNSFNNTETYSRTAFSKLANGTRNLVARYNGTLSPTWLLNGSFSWGHNYLNETPDAPNIYQILDTTGCAVSGTVNSTSCKAFLQPGTLNGPLGPMSGIFTRQGLGYGENTQGDNYGYDVETQKIVNKFGSHNFTVGYHYERNYYQGNKFRTGPSYTLTPKMLADASLPASLSATSNAAFQLRLASSGTSKLCKAVTGFATCPTMAIPGFGTFPVYLRMTRGEFGPLAFNTDGRYHAAFVNDSWAPNRFVTVNVGWRWEQQRLEGTPYHDYVLNQTVHTHYTFTDNWSPRIGLAIDPLGNRKNKIYGNFARYDYALPLDVAIRSLSNELDTGTIAWAPVADASNHVVINSDGTLANPVLDDAHYLTNLTGASLSSTENFSPNTKMFMMQEWVGGVEHEFPHSLVMDVRFVDRRVKRIVEDVAGISPEAFQNGLNQIYTITNPTPSTDLFINPIQVDYPVGGVPASCPLGGTATDFEGNSVGDFCVTNAVDSSGNQLAGILGHDGKSDGFAQPVRIYKAVEFELNKAFSKGWQVRSNYRWSQLSGNYEGAFRNDNGQSDPGISSLFDFVQGDFGLLGSQFAVGWLNTDRHHIFNNFISYTFSSGFMKNLTLGTGVRIQTGLPVSEFRAHPAYQNAGEIPQGGRGSLGRTPTNGQADIHADYGLKLTERHSLHFGADLFNITNQKTLTRVDEFKDRSYLVLNADYLKPRAGTGLNPLGAFQDPFSARLFAKWVF